MALSVKWFFKYGEMDGRGAGCTYASGLPLSETDGDRTGQDEASVKPDVIRRDRINLVGVLRSDGNERHSREQHYTPSAGHRNLKPEKKKNPKTKRKIRFRPISGLPWIYDDHRRPLSHHNLHSVYFSRELVCC